MKLAAASKGNDLLEVTESMSAKASSRLESMTKDAMAKVSRVQFILFVTIAATFIAGLWMAAHLTRSLTRPVETLVNATRAIASGHYGYSVAIRIKTEFGELAEHFNAMSSELQEGHERLQAEIAERRQAEEAMRISEERYALSAQGANDGLWDWNLVETGYIIAEMEGHAWLR